MKQETIRRPKPTDIEEIIRIWLEGNIQAHPFIQPDYWLKHMGYMREVLPQSEVYVYEQDGNILGFIGLQEHYIAGLFIDKNHQSQGIGTSLIEFIKQKHLSLTLTVYKKNWSALQFYQRHNFVVMGERTDTDNNEEELLLKWNRPAQYN